MDVTPPIGADTLKRVRVVALVLGVASAAVFFPYWPALLLAAWTGALLRPLLTRIGPRPKNEGKVAGLLTGALSVLVFLPLAVVTFVAAHEAIGLYAKLKSSGADREVLTALVQQDGGADTEATSSTALQHAASLLRAYGERAWTMAVALAGTVTNIVVSLVIFFWGTYAMLVAGPRARAWVELHCELPPLIARRLYNTFLETGRALLVGVGATSLVQGVVATVTYYALGVPRPLLLGFITLLFSVVPALGSGFVWVPVAIGFWVAGSWVKCVLMTVVGIFVIGTVDNIIRPVFARYARLQMSSFMLFVSMLGGLVVAGPFGILVGPLVVRLAKETLQIRRELAEASQAESPSTAPSAGS